MKWDEIKDDMDDQDDGSRIWKPENADEWISGEYFDIDEGIGVKGDSTMYHIRDSDGVHWKVWSTTVLESKMKKVDVGRTIKIAYKGKHQGKSGNFYKVFNVFVAEDEDKEEGEKSSPSSSSKSVPPVKLDDKLRFEANGFIKDARNTLIGYGNMEPSRRELETQLKVMRKEKDLDSDYGFKPDQILKACLQLLQEIEDEYNEMMRG